MRYAHSLPNSPSFTGKGLSGYAFGPLSLKSTEVEYMDGEKGHDTCQITKKVTRIYYVLSGTGHFIINDQRCDASPGLRPDLALTMHAVDIDGADGGEVMRGCFHQEHQTVVQPKKSSMEEEKDNASTSYRS